LPPRIRQGSAGRGRPRDESPYASIKALEAELAAAVRRGIPMASRSPSTVRILRGPRIEASVSDACGGRTVGDQVDGPSMSRSLHGRRLFPAAAAVALLATFPGITVRLTNLSAMRSDKPREGSVDAAILLVSFAVAPIRSACC